MSVYKLLASFELLLFHLNCGITGSGTCRVLISGLLRMERNELYKCSFTTFAFIAVVLLKHAF